MSQPTTTTRAKRNRRLALRPERARALLEYDPASGVLTWKVRKGSRARAGQRAGCAARFYRTVKVDGVIYYEHRVAWLIAHGSWPAEELDHINGDGFDNRLDNLREATRSANQANVSYSTRRAGATGVYYDKRPRVKNRWVARIRATSGKRAWLGRFATEAEATEAYASAHVARLAEMFPQEPG